jgi:phosphatidylglycerophosphate synthase
METPNHLSILGIIHTAISIIALLAAFYSLYRSGRIDPATGPGRLYIWLTIFTCLTAFPIMKTGHFTPGHYVAIVILVLLPLGIYARSLRVFGKLADYVQVIFLSTTLFLSLIPAINETLTRLPISNPIASGPNDPIVQKGLLALVLLYFVGVIYQIIKLRAHRRKSPPPLNNAVS